MLTILGVSLENAPKDDIAKKIGAGTKPLFVLTLNPEILLRAWKDSGYRRVINNADLKVIDGVGIVLIAQLLYGVKLTRFAGADLANEIVQWAVKNNKRVFLLGGSSDVNQRATQNLITNYQLLITNIKGLGGNFTEQEAIKKIATYKPDVLFVALGAPKQEFFISKLQATCLRQGFGGQANYKLQTIMVGIGGAIDYWAHPGLRAPNVVRRLGFEWLWRVILQPWRLLRIFKAVILFPLACIWEKIYVK